MSLSDACFDFIQGLQDAAREGPLEEFLEALTHYGSPEFGYHAEDITNLVNATKEAMQPDALNETFVQLLVLANQTRQEYDAPP